MSPSPVSRHVSWAMEADARYGWIDRTKKEWSPFISSLHTQDITAWPCTRGIVPGLFYCNFCKEHRPHSRRLLRESLEDAQRRDPYGYGQPSSPVNSEFLDKATDSFWEDFDPELCPLKPCPFSHSTDPDRVFRNQVAECKSGKVKNFMNYDNGYNFSSYKSVEDFHIIQQSPTTGSPIDCSDGHNILGDSFAIHTEGGLNRLSWSVMKALVSPFRSYSCEQGACRRTFWTPHALFDPAAFGYELGVLRKAYRELDAEVPAMSTGRKTQLVLAHHLRLDELDSELDRFIHQYAPYDRLLSASWFFSSDITCGSHCHGLEVGRAFGGSSNSLLHNISDAWSYYGSDVGFAELTNLYGMRKWGSSSYVYNSTYVTLCSLLPRSTRTSPGLRHALYRIQHGEQAANGKLEERVGDTIELICTLALLYNQTSLFSLIIQALVKISVVEFYDHYKDPWFIADPFAGQEFNGKKGSARDPSWSDATWIQDYLKGLVCDVMPDNWQRASALGKKAKSAHFDMSWAAFGHPDVYISSDLKVFSHARYWVRYLTASRPSLVEGRSSRGLRQGYAALRMKAAVARFLESPQMTALVGSYFPGHSCPLRVREASSRCEKRLRDRIN
ncbi:hypothetical protein FOL47_004171 [Perkinsus chesapeaki]|uniref:Uncharacterized protein n=1 Tax=Perkinsus chesapeaki TaxID=330153 RepID=A0A7J6M419_PERCH|nr:hypothetical protein FOL47_004171 [Perkinsus chesapeaki]